MKIVARSRRRSNCAASRRQRRQKGQSLLEGALVTAMVVLMITFVLDMGQLLMYMQFVSDRARLGGRYATVSIQDESAVRGQMAYNNPQMQPSADDEPAGVFGLKPSQVAVNHFTTAQGQDMVEVQIQNFPLRSFTPFLPGSMNGKSMKVVLPVESLGATN